jgi:hypothetical protein
MFDYRKIVMDVPAYNTDKVIGIIEGSTSVAAPTAIQTVVGAESMNNTGFGETCLTSCVYSLDGGTTWNDNDMTIPDTSDPAFTVTQTCDVTSFSRGNQVGIAVSNWYNFNTGTGTVRNIQYRIYCLAKYNQGSITPIPTNEPIYFRSTDNYLKVQPGSNVPQSYTPLPAGDQTFSYAHNLGYIPNARAYMEYTASDEIWPVSINQYPTTGLATNRNKVPAEIRLTTTNMNVFMSGALRTGTPNIKLYPTVYLDD